MSKNLNQYSTFQGKKEVNVKKSNAFDLDELEKELEDLL